MEPRAGGGGRVDRESGGGRHPYNNTPRHAFPISFRVQERMSPRSPHPRILREGNGNARVWGPDLPAGHLHPNTGARPGRIH